jgi:hypothetical protein
VSPSPFLSFVFFFVETNFFFAVFALFQRLRAREEAPLVFFFLFVLALPLPPPPALCDV